MLTKVLFTAVISAALPFMVKASCPDHCESTSDCPRGCACTFLLDQRNNDQSIFHGRCMEWDSKEAQDPNVHFLDPNERIVEGKLVKF